MMESIKDDLIDQICGIRNLKMENIQENWNSEEVENKILELLK